MENHWASKCDATRSLDLLASHLLALLCKHDTEVTIVTAEDLARARDGGEQLGYEEQPYLLLQGPADPGELGS